MKPNYYKIIQDCVETGTSLGYQRAHKHDDKPERVVLEEKIIEAIMQQISENFIFDTLP
jgi:hypothetical protein